MFSNLTIAFIGSGNMGEAMIHGLIQKGMVEAEQIIAADPRIEHLQALHERYQMRYTTDNLDAATQADILVLSVKPQVLDEVLHEVRSGARTCSLVVSIVAGSPIKKDRGRAGECLGRARHAQHTRARRPGYQRVDGDRRSPRNAARTGPPTAHRVWRGDFRQGRRLSQHGNRAQRHRPRLHFPVHGSDG